MSRPFLWMLVALFAAPALAYLAYRVAQRLGFLDPPIDKQHEHRREIAIALYAFLLFLPVLIYGFEKGWPRAWIFFGILNGLALVFFAASGIWSALRLWKLRGPGVSLTAPQEAPPPELETRRGEEPRADPPAAPEETRRTSG